jgi:hypothetical protein
MKILPALITLLRLARRRLPPIRRPAIDHDL